MPRPTPKQATLGDFISANSFAALQVPEPPEAPRLRPTFKRSGVALDSQLISCLANPRSAKQPTVCKTAEDGMTAYRQQLQSSKCGQQTTTTTATAASDGSPVLCIENENDDEQILAAASEAVMWLWIPRRSTV